MKLLYLKSALRCDSFTTICLIWKHFYRKKMSLGDFLVGGRGWGEGVIRGKLSIEECVMGEENFHEGSAGFLAFFKEQWKNKYEKVSSTESKEQH